MILHLKAQAEFHELSVFLEPRSVTNSKKLKNEESIKVATMINICSKLNFTKLFLIISKLDNLVKCYRSGSLNSQLLTVVVLKIGHLDIVSGLYKLVTEPYKRIISLASRLSKNNPHETLENEISSLKALLGETNDLKSLNDSKTLYLDFQPKNVENFEVIIFILLTAIAISGQFEIGMMHIDILVRVSTSYQGMIHLYKLYTME